MPQLSMFDGKEALASVVTPAEVWNLDATKRTLDELFHLTYQYRASKAYQDLMQFVVRFRSYSPFNAMLVHIQMPGASFVAPPHRWSREYGRRIRPGARPLVILQPMGPVMFVFDVSETEPTENAPPLPREVLNPFEVRKGKVGDRLRKVVENVKRDGLRLTGAQEGSQSAGSIRRAAEKIQVTQRFQAGDDEHKIPVLVDIPVKYELVTNTTLSPEAQYVTIVHELAHLYCGHLGTPNKEWWPDRRGLKPDVEEFEAESVAFMICARARIDNPSERYLAGYVGKTDEVPSISLECVMKAAGLIETMSLQKMKLRKPSKHQAGK